MRIIKSTVVLLVLTQVLFAGCKTASFEEAAPASNIKLPALFTDNMVLQREMKMPVWGWADPGGKVAVSIDTLEAEAIAGDDGRWMARLGPLPAGGPYNLTVAGEETVKLTNVMVGEVWVCSGQSNMQWPARLGRRSAADAEQEIAAAKHPNIRLFSVPMVTSFVPRDDCKSKGWAVCNPETVPEFSAVGYFFGRYLHKQLDVPVGLIQSAWGGTVAEAWTSESALKTLPDFKPKLARMAAILPRLDEMEREYRRKVADWEAALDGHDAGYWNNEPVWAEPGFDASGWESMDLPQVWENAGLERFDGFVWFRKEVEIPAADAGKPMTLRLGPINDMDRTWFNGTKVGSLEIPNRWNTPRVYDVSGDLVKPGRNVITVRVYDTGGNGGVCGNAEQLKLVVAGAEESAIPLAGPWLYKPGLDMRTVPGKPRPPAIRMNNPNVPTVLHNAMISPLIPYGIRGAIWYQGESNAGRAYQYRTLFPTMIQDWRANWEQGDFPFLFVQLANFQQVKPEPGDDEWAELREAQSMALSLPNTGMAVTIDIGEANDIHPRNKQDVGKRLGLAARAIVFDEKIVYSGPIYESMRVEGNAIRLRFNHVGGGLVAKGEQLKGFAIAGDDRKFVWADARIEDDTVVVESDEVRNPVAVRYAWAINPVCNLYNKDGLPASPFRTDDWPGITRGKK